MAKEIVIAADLGASGGKMSRGCFDGKKLLVDCFFDFSNRPMALNGNLYWDLFGLYRSLLQGCSLYTKDCRVKSVGVDSWGATYGLLDKRGRLLEPVYHYRDLRTEHSLDRLYQVLPKRELFELTGCQPARSYTLPQLYSYLEHGDKVLELAENMLLLPDLMEYFLTGEASTERSIAGTTGLMKPEQEDWERKVLGSLGIPDKMLTPIVDAGTLRGKVLDDVAGDTGLGEAKVIATVGHDTAAGVAGIPGFGVNQVYISAGTNINMGIELSHSVISQKAYEGGFKNAGVLEGRKILYRDFAAFWLLNELRRTWEEEGKSYDYAGIMKMAAAGRSRRVYLDVEDDGLNNPGGNMKEKINRYLVRTGQEELESDGEFARCIFESIALKVKYCTEFLNQELAITLHRVSVINGGTRSHVLMQMFSNGLGMPVYCGLPYATLTGNALTQLYALGEVGSVEEMRELSQRSFPMKEFLPVPGEKQRWDEDLQKMQERGICR